MLLCIAIGGGLKLMMGRHARSESLFYYFRLEDQTYRASIQMNKLYESRTRCRSGRPLGA